MIDYEKLKLAHELIKKLPHHQASFYFGDIEKEDSFTLWEDWASEEDFATIDDLLTKLKELTQQKPKYAVGQVVWFIYRNEIINSIILVVDWSEIDNTYHYDMDIPRLWWKENEVFSSREALIEAQIAYWTSIKQEQKSPWDCCEKCQEPEECCDCEECPHQYTFESGFRCVKCGYNVSDTAKTDAAIKIATDHAAQAQREREKESTCEHESDGLQYARCADLTPTQIPLTLNPTATHMSRCKHCGEFYR